MLNYYSKYFIFGILIFLIGILMISGVFAMTWDNKKVIDGNKVIIEDNFGYGGKLVEVEKIYNTDFCLSECYTVWNVTIYKDDDNFLDEIDFYDVYNSNRLLNYKFEYVSSIKETEIDDYETICSGKGNNTICTQGRIGSHTEYTNKWSSFDPKRKLSLGNYMIKLTGYKEMDEDIDWKPTFYGKRIDEWAWWHSGEPIGYWKFNEEADGGFHNATDNSTFGQIANNTLIVNFSLGKLINSANFTDTLSYFDVGVAPDLYDINSSFTIAVWYKTNKTGTTYDMIKKWDGSLGSWRLVFYSGNNVFWSGYDRDAYVGPEQLVGWNDSIIDYTNNEWHRVVFVYDQPNELGTLYYDGNIINQSTVIGNFSSGNSLRFGDTDNFDMELDDLQIWNISWSDADVTTDWDSGKGRELDDIIIITNTVTYNATTYDTYTEGFEINVTYNDSGHESNITSVLNYDNIDYTTHLGDDDGSDAIFNNSITIPLNTVGAKIFYWNFTLTNDTGDISYLSSSSYTQTITAFNFTICDNTINVPYLNFSFKEEGTNVILDGKITDFSFEYWIDSSNTSANKTYSFSASEFASNFTFCFVPSDKTLYNYYSLKYSGDGYPQRRYKENDDLTSTVTNKVLHLLNSTDGIYSIYQVQDEAGGGISGVIVQVERQIDEVWTLLEEDITDSVGAVTFWLDPNYNHRLTFTKSGYTSVQVILRPSSSTYTLTMTLTGTIDYVSSLERITYNIWPSGGRLTPGLNYTFGVNITAEADNVNECLFELINETDDILVNTTGCNSFGGNISVVLNSSEAVKIWGVFSLDLGDGYFRVDADAFWWRETLDKPSRGTLIDFFINIRNVKQLGGETEDNRREFTRIVFFFFIMTIMLGFVSYSTGWDIASQGGIILVVVLMWIVSIPGFLNLSGISPFRLMDKYFIALISTMILGGFIFNDLAKR